MIAEFLIGFFISLLVALIMIGIGISQLKSKTPAAFYTGEKPLSPKELSDVDAWNRKHGHMWITYGIVILLSYLLAALVGLDTTPGLIVYCNGIVLPIVVMIWYHNKLTEIYRLPKKKQSKQKPSEPDNTRETKQP